MGAASLGEVEREALVPRSSVRENWSVGRRQRSTSGAGRRRKSGDVLHRSSAGVRARTVSPYVVLMAACREAIPLQARIRQQLLHDRGGTTLPW